MNEFHCEQSQPSPKRQTLHVADYNLLLFASQSKKDDSPTVIYEAAQEWTLSTHLIAAWGVTHHVVYNGQPFAGGAEGELRVRSTPPSLYVFNWL